MCTLPDMSTINPPTDAASANTGLKITLTVFSTLGFGVWGTSIGFLLGWDHGAVFLIAGFAERLSIISNAAMIYITSRILFLVMVSTPSASLHTRPVAWAEFSR